jgi:hypothetical protein
MALEDAQRTVGLVRFHANRKNGGPRYRLSQDYIAGGSNRLRRTGLMVTVQRA